MPQELSREVVLKVARLARLALTEDEIRDFSQQLGRVLEYMDRLQELDTSQVEPLVHAIEITNVLREDVVCPSLPREAALANAPKTDGQYFLVPAILD
ncbi:MAG: aspartyl/glutamyl-tRNA(Asn/Gln) amidotransferase subunit C [Planctomycetaceae bacterium]|nr:MAG: aspartyl/glutamyl-tRNA(Asn/Gln) amidotransferase subunit C [Planctomycetaceae bacterium]